MQIPKFTHKPLTSRFILADEQVTEELSSSFCPVRFYTFPVAPGMQIETHTHDDGTHFVFVRTGRLRYTLGEKRQEVGPGDFIIIPPDVPHSFETVGDEAASVIAFDAPLSPHPDES